MMDIDTSRQCRSVILGVLSVIMSVLVITAPVSASHTTVISIHTTNSDFNSAKKLDNITVASDSANLANVPALDDGFEDGDTNLETNGYDGWNGEINAKSSASMSGSYIGYLALGNADTDTATFNSDSDTPSYASADIRLNASTTAGCSANLTIQDGTTDIGSVGLDCDNNNIIVNGKDNAGGWDNNVPYDVEFANINYSNNSFDVIIDGTNKGTYSFLSSTNKITRMEYLGYWGSTSTITEAPIDDVEWGSSAFETGTYLSANHTVEDPVSGFTDLTLTNANATVEWQGWGGSSWKTVDMTTYSTSGNKTVSLSGGYTTWRVKVTYEDTSVGNGSPTASLADEGVTAVANSPQVDNSSADPSGGEKNTKRTVTLSINVSDKDFPKAHGDTATVDFYVDGSKVGSDALTSNGTASYDYDDPTGGSHDWHVEVSDEYGHTQTSDTFTFQTPETLYIRNESNPDQLVKDASVTVKFYTSNKTVERTTNDGTVNLTGLPVGETIIVTADAPGYHGRHSVIKGLYEQQSVYLLNESMPSVEVRFKLDDATGNFDTETSRVYIKRALNQSGSTTYKTVAADEFGVAGFTSDLKDGARYRIVVENQQGDQRVLGSYTASVSETVTLRIGEIKYGIKDPNTGIQWDAAYQNRSTGDRITFNFSDPSENTSELRLVIYERGNKSNFTIVNKTFSGPIGEVSFTEPLNTTEEGRTYVVEWEADKGGETIKGQRIVGENYGPGLPLAGDWKFRGGIALILFTGGIVGGVRPAVGAISVSMLGGVMWFMGWLPPAVGGGAIAMAIGIGVMFNIRRGL